MHPILGSCPICGETLVVTRLQCHNCDTTIDGQFTISTLDRLNADQITFAVTFIRCEGKLNRMEKELGLSYPTLRVRLNELIKAMGFEVGQEEAAGVTGVSDEERRQILDDLAAGRLTSEEAVKRLQGNS